MTGDNPILNNPYEEPRFHYATNPSGELDYAKVLGGRRIFTGQLQSIPVRQQQPEIFSVQDLAAEYAPLLVNRLRVEVARWRNDKYPQTTRITRELLTFWFLNAEREPRQKLFFAQREAVETAIWLNEVAPKSNAGTFILQELAASTREQESLPRIAFKMATGSGKTVVMAALIAYHFFNRREYANDTRFADNFLIVAPGVTIRDRLSVLRVDSKDDSSAADYYYQRHLVPRGWRPLLHELNRRLVITNYHAFEPRTLQGNKRSPFDGKVGADGRKSEAREDYAQVFRRVLDFRPGSRLLVLNDEAHHCYLPREDTRTAEGEDVKKENARAAVWFTGVRELAARYKLTGIYDLSATPFFLSGSGYTPYSLFPWIVSDFGLTEAIESGLVKIPFLPTWDDTQELDMPVLRNLYEHVRNELPKAGQRKARTRAKEQGEDLVEAPPVLPDTLKIALRKFHDHYQEDFHRRTHSMGAGERQLAFTDTPPVFIVVCNNTSVSKEVYKYLAGYEVPGANEADAPVVRPGLFDLFSNYDPVTLKPRQRPPSLLIDSDALENSGQIDEDFKRIFSPEIALFKKEYARTHGAASAEAVTDGEILREVVNTVGKRGALGAHVRCIVSVSMLTEGWDANTVTHIVGLRAFGSQLLCEQVAGRALRRRSYQLRPYDADTGEELPATTRRKQGILWKFPPEYAHIIGVPFKLFKGGKSVVEPPENLTAIHPVAERSDLEISFPVVDGYRIEYPETELTWDLSALEDFVFDASTIPTETHLGSAFSAAEEKLSARDVLGMRNQAIIYGVTRVLLRDHFSADRANPEFHKFHQLHALVGEWYHTKVRVLGRDREWRKLLWFHDPKPLAAHIVRAVHPGTDTSECLRPILNYYNPTSCTCFVRGQTSRETYPTRHSHINAVVIDSGWEGKAAKTLDDLADEGHVLAWVKNAFLDFKIPYTDKDGSDRHYLPDFIVHARLAGGGSAMVIVEVSGLRHDKTQKKWAVTNRWLPAVNAVRERHGWPQWDFIEVADAESVADLRNLLLEKLTVLAMEQRLTGVWAARREHELVHGPGTEDFELPERRVNDRPYVNPLD